MLEKDAASTETPWGLPWSELLPSLRPPASHANRLASLAAKVDDLLRAASLGHDELVVGGSVGKRTALPADRALDLFAVVPDFRPAAYFDAHLAPLLAALKLFAPREDGLAAAFVTDDVAVRVFAAGRLYAGPLQLVLPAALPAADAVSPREVHADTSCALLRVRLVSAQSPLYHDMVRVAKKWRDSARLMSRADTPPDYLLELLMLHAVHAAPVLAPGPHLYAAIFRRFLATIAGTAASASDAAPADAAPRTFLSWEHFYSRPAVDHCISRGLLDVGRSDACSLVVVDPAAPFLNVARTVPDWSELRRAARDSLSAFKSSELLESLQMRLAALSAGMEETLGGLHRKIDALQRLEESPRRWSGTVQFNEAHMNSDAWTSVCEVELRTVLWRVNARRARSEGVGYSATVDISLQMLGHKLTRTIDVDVSFRSSVVNLVFDDKVDHVLIAKRSEVIRNRDYPMQITIVA